MRRVLAFVGVLLAPCIAKRLGTDEVAVGSVLELETGESAELFSEDALAMLEEAAAEEKQQTQQWCTATSAMQQRTYYFELVYPNGERTAMELDRHPRDPKLRFYRGRTWSVRLVVNTTNRAGHTEESLEWKPVLPDDEGMPRLDEHGEMTVDDSNPLVVDIRKEVAFIRRKTPEGETKTEIEFGFMNGNSQTFAGGLYFPENAMKRALVRAYNRRQREIRRGDPEAEVSTQTRHAGTSGQELTVGGGGMAVRSTTGVVRDLVHGAKISGIMSFAFAFFPNILGSGFAAFGMAWTAATAGAWTATVWALPIVIPSAIWNSIHKWRHERHELEMSAAEKLFEKFQCHRMIGVCEGAELVGREAVTIFAGRPDMDTLIPINGDVDVITRQPLLPVVSWRQPVNNSGNIECVDRRVYVWGN